MTDLKSGFNKNCYAVKLITKGGFITVSRSQELNLRQLQIKFNLSMRQTIL